MSSVNQYLAFFLVTLALVGRSSCGTAFSHVFQSTPDYTISHKHFHDHAALAEPFLLSKTQPEPSSPYSTLTAANNEGLGPLYVNQPEYYSAQEEPRATVQVEKQKQDDLPPGYTSLPAMINIPPGYQLFRRNPQYYR
ncbi:uncharacterized protein LOC103315340 [Nasonia vitripennis]|uniref:Uncharacterized protein n=1 Tax=Nasonia vitripennis TaxID=7425 RepID=A0A7M7H6R5_NASVI|nr:uncharacterized protein LOC103315340 [Nasonia vitripennis]